LVERYFPLAPLRNIGAQLLSEIFLSVPSENILGLDIFLCRLSNLHLSLSLYTKYRQSNSKMRPLTEEETQAVFKKLAEYTGASLKNIIAPQEDGDRNVFRLSQNRVYVVRLSMANLATSIARDNLLSLGTCLGMS
jgi:hypothetical protein